MEQNPSSEANKEFVAWSTNSPRLTGYKGSQGLASGPSLVTDEYSPYPSPYFLNIHFSIIQSPMQIFSETNPSFKFPHQRPVCVFPVPHTCHIPRPSRSPWFDHLRGISWTIRVMKLPVCSFLNFSVINSLLGTTTPLSTLFSNTLSLCSSLNMTHQFSHPYTTGKIIVLYILVFGDRCGTVVKVLCYKSEGRWFDPRWCHWNFSFK